jgi:hypothetical protein
MSRAPMQSLKSPMCARCLELLRASQPAAHPDLVLLRHVAGDSRFPCEEFHYACARCQHAWMHESGSYGYGWFYIETVCEDAKE